MKRPGARRAAALVAAHNHAILMRDIFTEIFENQPLDPSEAARRGARAALRKRFYSRAHVGEARGRRLPAAARRQAGQDAGAARAGRAERRARRKNRRGMERASRSHRSGAHAAHPARQCGDRRGGRCARAGRRRGGAISRLRSAVLSRRGAGRPGRAAGAALGPGAGLGARRARRPLRAGAGRDACGAAGRGGRRRARENSRRRTDIGGWARCRRSPRSPARRCWRWRSRTARSMPRPPGPPRMSTRTGRCRNGAATKPRSNAAPIAAPSSTRRSRCCG